MAEEASRDVALISGEIAHMGGQCFILSSHYNDLEVFGVESAVTLRVSNRKDARLLVESQRWADIRYDRIMGCTGYRHAMVIHSQWANNDKRSPNTVTSYKR